MQKFWNAIGWFATVISIIGSGLMAFGFVVYGYGLFILGSSLYVARGYATKDNPVLVLNLAFFVINCIGFVRNF